jgi:hypothetical protein
MYGYGALTTSLSQFQKVSLKDTDLTIGTDTRDSHLFLKKETIIRSSS